MSESSTSFLPPDFNAEAFLVDILGAQRVSRKGHELIHSCLLPFGLHRNGDRNPSASLNEDKLVYYCFACSSGGTLLWATSTILNLSTYEAKRLIQKNLPENTPHQFIEHLDRIWTVTTDITALPQYSDVLLKPWTRTTRYLSERGISEDVQVEMKTGVNLHNSDQIRDEWIEQPRLVIPHFYLGKLRGWQLRKLDSRQAGPKYKNSPGFPKDASLYNYDAVNKNEPVIVVESPMSVLRLKTLGYNNCVATFGAAVTDRQVSLLRRFESLVFFPDGDLPGYTSTHNISKQLMETNKVWIIDHGLDGKDAADFESDELKDLFSQQTAAYMWSWRPNETYAKTRR